jgi:hypothetical protein
VKGSQQRIWRPKASGERPVALAGAVPRSIAVMPGIGGIADADLRRPELREEDCN